MWRVELKKTKTKIWFEKGWDEFMDYYSINVGHLLVFRYDGNSLFHVTIFDMSATEIDVRNKSSSDAVEESDDSVEILDNARFKPVKFETVEVDTDNECESSQDEQTDSHGPFKEKFTYQFNGSSLEAAKASKSKNPVCTIVMRRTYSDKGPV
ncbi:hypothetical protein MKW94_015585, partial [Papaver nudicaule]|nr:hypothetical protein [Papaver nudicaule]